MFVVFGPNNSDRTYFDNKIWPIINKNKKDCPVFTWKQGNRSCAFLGGEPFPDLLWSPKGWFLGYAYWDSLPHGYERGTKNLLEVSLDLWKKEGIDFLKRLNGSFNLFLYDAASGKSLLSSDRFGTYPLWMAELGEGGYAFSPDYNRLTPFINTDVDPAGMWSFVSRACPVANHTLLAKIKGVPQATLILFDGHEKPEIKEWFAQVFKPEPDRSLNY
jgi:asparagine synthetase B (glutamine-hydrolysing)